MADHLIGAHMPTGKGLGSAVRAGHAIGCTAIQVFTSSPQMWKAVDPTPEKVADFKAACAETGIDSVVSHDSYLVNLCAVSDEILDKSLNALKGELRRCGMYGIRFVVSHIGAHMGQGEDEGLRIAAENTLRVLDDSPDDVTLLAETTAGQGSALNSSFECLAKFFELTKAPKRLGVCLDTCHIFAAGYDLRTPETYEATFARFDELVSLSNLKAIHCNDSKMAFGSRKDRHAHLGQGEIGPTAFELLVKDKRFFQTPILIETPEAETEHATNVALLWDLAKNG